MKASVVWFQNPARKVVVVVGIVLGERQGG